MKKIIALLTAAFITSISNAAVYHVTGTITGWTAANNIGGGTYTNYADITINVFGTVSTIGSGFIVSAMNLNQVGIASGQVLGASDGSILSISGLNWSLGSNANDAATATSSDFALIQGAGAAASCSGTSIACNAVASAINAGGAASAMNFDGIGATEAWLDNNLLLQHEGPKGGVTFTSVIPNFNGPDTVRLIYTLNAFTAAGSPVFDSNNRLTLFLDIAPVPVPAAAWLMGSGLAGLITLKRRKK